MLTFNDIIWVTKVVDDVLHFGWLECVNTTKLDNEHSSTITTTIQRVVNDDLEEIKKKFIREMGEFYGEASLLELDSATIDLITGSEYKFEIKVNFMIGSCIVSSLATNKTQELLAQGFNVHPKMSAARHNISRRPIPGYPR